MQAGFFEKQIVLTPDLCGSAAALSPLAAFTIFQGIASEHAERIGVGEAVLHHPSLLGPCRRAVFPPRGGGHGKAGRILADRPQPGGFL